MLSTPPRNPFPVRINRSASGQQPPPVPRIEEVKEAITVQVDQYLEHTYHGLITRKIDSLCKPEFAPTNSLLINYIRHIYAKYALEDPMRKYGDQRFWGTAQTRARSVQKDSPMRSFDTTRRSLAPGLESPGNPEQTGSHSRYLTPEKSYAESRATGNDNSLIQMPSGMEQVPMRGSLGLSAAGSSSRATGAGSFGHATESRVEHERPSESTKQIDAVFRYCFSCERSVLEFNMLNHEKNCPNFLELYQKSPEEIISMLETKIERMKGEMVEVLNRKEESRLKDLKNAVESWLGRVQQSQKVKVLTWEYEKDYNRIRDCYRSSELMLLELSYKLRWFMRIREELKNKFGL